MKRARRTFGGSLIAIWLAVSLVACGASDSMKRAETPGPMNPESGVPGAGQPVLTDLMTQTAPGHTRVVMRGNQPLTFNTARVDNPPAVDVQVSAVALDETVGVKAIQNGTVESVEVARVPNRENLLLVRVLLTEQTTYRVEREGSDLVVLVDNVRGAVPTPDGDMEPPLTDLGKVPISSGRPRIKAIDFKPVGSRGRTRLVVETDQEVNPQVLSRNEGRTVVLSVVPAKIAAPLSRPLNTSYFQSAVDSIEPIPAKGGVEFRINLRESVPYHLGRNGTYTLLDFDASRVPPKKATLLSRAEETTTMTGEEKPASGETSEATPDQAATMTAEAPSKRKRVASNAATQRISVDFQKADLHNTIRLIAEISGKNVIVSEKVAGEVTLKLEEVPWDEALRILLDTYNLDMVESENVIRIDSADTIKSERETKLKEEEEALERAKKQPLEKAVFTPKYAAVDIMKTELEKLKTERGKIMVIGNDIHVSDEGLILAEMEKVFKKYDTVAKQILIESRIVEATMNFSKRLGVNWGGGATETDPGWISGGGELNIGGLYEGGTPGVDTGGIAVNLISPTSVGLGMGIGIISDAVTLDAELWAMEASGDGRIVSAPRILALNDQTVFIKSGTAVPTETTSTGTAPSTITFEEYVLQLDVTPHIEENGEIITLDVKVKKDTPDYARSATNPPKITREAQTKLMVKDGETVVIGGVIVDESSKVVNRVPGLHKIPVLGNMFKHYEVEDTKSELLIFLTSNIIPVRI